MIPREGTLRPSIIREMNTRILFAATIIGGALTAQAEEWTSWRGDGLGSGAALKANTVSKFSEEENLVWKTELPGPGNSTPIVADGKIIVTCGIGGKDAVVAYDLKGKELWREVFGSERAGKGDNKQKGTGSNSSAVTDGNDVFVYYKSGRVAGVTLKGKKKWEFNVQEKYGKDTLWWDEGTSPVLAGGRVVVAVMQTEGGSYLVSFNKSTGDVEWKTDRTFDVAPESGDSYATPLVMDIDGKETIVCWGADHLTGHDAKTGEQVWFCGGYNPKKNKFWRTIAGPAATDGIVALSFGRGAQTGAVKVGGKGDITKGAWLWKEDLGADSASPVAFDGKFIFLTDSGPKRGLVTCLEAKSGKKIWDVQLPRAAQKFYASPFLAGDKLYVSRVDGTVFCGMIGKEGVSNLTENKIEDNIYASPIAIGDRLYIRGRHNLYCFGKK